MSPTFIGEHPSIIALRALIARVAPTMSSVLIVGETGVGKDVVAELLHVASACTTGPYIVASCASMPPDLFAAQMFGAIKGAYTGAVADQAGLFPAADGGTLVLDDVAVLPWDLQAMLLRVLETGEVRRLGASDATRVAVRVIATTNESPHTLLATKRMREDFYYRLATMEIAISPLHDRAEDIPALLAYRLASINAERGERGPLTIDLTAIALCIRYSWPGNVRELFHALDAAAIQCDGETIYPQHFPPAVHRGFVVGDLQRPNLDVRPFVLAHALQETEAQIIAEALRRTNHLTSHAARMLGVKRTTLRHKILTYRRRGLLEPYHAPPRASAQHTKTSPVDHSPLPQSPLPDPE